MKASPASASTGSARKGQEAAVMVKPKPALPAKSAAPPAARPPQKIGARPAAPKAAASAAPPAAAVPAAAKPALAKPAAAKPAETPKPVPAKQAAKPAAIATPAAKPAKGMAEASAPLPTPPAAASPTPRAADTKATQPKMTETRAPEPKAAEIRPVETPRPPQPMMQNGRPMPPSRAAAKEENFVEGDYVVYPTHGVGKVERIVREDIAGHSLELIHITFEENRMTLRVPVTKARTAGLRKLATRKMFDEALAVLKGRARIKRTMWSRRAQEYEARSTRAIRSRLPRWCATCTAMPASPTRASPSGRSTRRRWTAWPPSLRRWTRPTSRPPSPSWPTSSRPSDPPRRGMLTGIPPSWRKKKGPGSHRGLFRHAVLSA